jgi:hypothetical protein
MNYLPLAEQCGLIEEHPVNHSSVEYLADLQRFAELVAAHEREGCLNCYSPDDTATDWADKIRARGQG